MARKTSTEVDEQSQVKLDEAKAKLHAGFADRLNAGLPITLEEWRAMQDDSKDVWEECYAEWHLKNIALTAHFLADSIRGGTLAIEAVWDILPENVQNKYLAAWSTKNADQNKKSD